MTPQQVFNGICAIIIGQMIGGMVSIIFLSLAWKVK